MLNVCHPFAFRQNLQKFSWSTPPAVEDNHMTLPNKGDNDETSLFEIPYVCLFKEMEEKIPMAI